jgi:hypothetical protein
VPAAPRLPVVETYQVRPVGAGGGAAASVTSNSNGAKSRREYCNLTSGTDQQPISALSTE